jgi:hypothetical protein
VRAAALVVAFLSIALGIAGLVSPGMIMSVRREYLATAAGLHLAGAVRIAMGLVLILFAKHSRFPMILRLFGAAMFLQGLVSQFYSVERALAILDWEAMLGATRLRVGAAVALCTGGFIAAAARPRGLAEHVDP